LPISAPSVSTVGYSCARSRIYSNDLQTLEKTADRIVAVLAAVPGSAGGLLSILYSSYA
jgi:hypothetical protein